MPACPQAIEAIGRADAVVIGPGSWFTSVLPHLLIPDVPLALDRSQAQVIVILNLAAQTGETTGFSPEKHLEVLARHAPTLRVHDVLADPSRVSDVGALAGAAAAMGARLSLAPIAARDGSPSHDVDLLASALGGALALSAKDAVTGR